MSYIIYRNTTQGVQPPAPPLNPNGEPYQYEVVSFGGDYRGYYDTHADILEHLTGEPYTTLTDAQKEQQRINHARTIRNTLQADILSVHKTDDLTEQQNATLYKPLTQQNIAWDSEIPLVLVEEDYTTLENKNRPHSTLEDVQNPRNIIWLRTNSEKNYIESLANVGYIILGIKEQQTK